MTASISDASVATTDPTLTLGVLFAVAAGFFAVAVHYYLRLTAAAERLALSRTRKRLRRSARFLTVKRIGRLLWLIDVTCVLTLRAVVGVYLGILWFLVVPLLMTLGSIMLAASLMS